MAESEEKLFSEFPPVSAQQWTEKITADLKGVPFEKKMIWKTGEGFDVNPFYCAEDVEGMATTTSLPGEFPYVRGTKVSNRWLVRRDLNVTDNFKAANEKVKRWMAEGSVDSIGFHLKGDTVNAANLAQLLDGVCPEQTELNFKTCNSKTIPLIGLLTELFHAKGVDTAKCSGSIAYNPFKKPLVKGIALGDDWVNEAVAVVKAGEALPKYRVLAVDACFLNDAGSYITQELGYSLAWGNEWIAKLSEAGLPVSTIAGKIQFNFGITSNYFMEIAKFRAARWLWAEIVKGYKPPCDCKHESSPEAGEKCGDDCGKDGFCTCTCKMKTHVRTSKWNMTIFDTYVNMLRTQTEAMSAAIAGVDSMTILPYDERFRTADDFSERIARNQQLILKEECHFDKIVDPGAGSYYIEKLTQSLAEAGWKLFLEVEEKGGFAALADSGEVQNAVNTSGKARRDGVATRRLSLLGTNQYPNFTEVAGDEIEETSACSCRCSVESDGVTKLNFAHGASEFETLRLATEKSGKRPKVFMLTIGNPAMRLARAQFAANFFGCAGYEIIDNLGFETITAGVNAAREKQVDILVLCSSDDEYTTLAPEALRLTGDSQMQLVIAGAPACMDDLKAAGITNFIHVKSNVLETLRTFNQKMNIRERKEESQ